MTDSRRTDTKQKLIETALDEIQQKGYQQVSIREIAKKNQLTAAAVYKHFGGKEDLMLEVLARASQQFEAYLTEYLAEHQTEDSYQKVVLLGEANVRWNEEEALLAEFLFFSPVATRALQQYIDDQNSPFIGLSKNYKIIAHFVEENQLSMDPKRMFIQLWSFIQGYATLVKNHICPYERTFIEETLDALIRGLISK
ncbi:TetR/AcrR family transcriptional regulator [Enterococcus sp. AZ109]|uniref:TetR/AcrR family transcriptional regulator n=1 Tax=Enterococcus sp. AZ109 TaxID=2774634 RepID=UPI003F27B0E8